MTQQVRDIRMPGQEDIETEPPTLGKALLGLGWSLLGFIFSALVLAAIIGGAVAFIVAVAAWTLDWLGYL